jgi:hypothetical protein
MPVFWGSPWQAGYGLQTGYGLGGLFHSMARAVVPLVKKGVYIQLHMADIYSYTWRTDVPLGCSCLLLFCLVKHNVDLKYITNVKPFDVDLVSEDKVNSTANCGFIAIFHRINTPASTSLYFKRLGFLKQRLNYYANCTASYNPSIITMSQSGDIHPLPGPGQRENITHIRCLYMNARSLVNKTNEFQALAVDTDCIFAVETWLKPHIF